MPDRISATEGKRLMAKLSWCSESVYHAVELLVDRSLCNGRSLFTDRPGVWRPEPARVLEERLGEDGEGSEYIEKLLSKLRGLPDEIVLLAAEALFLELLGELDTGGTTRRDHLRAVLGLLAEPVSLPSEVEAALDGGGVARYGMGRAHRNAYLQFYVRVVQHWPPDRASDLLADPWAFRDFVKPMATSTDEIPANALLHLVFPDTFETVVSPSHRTLLLAAFARAPSVSGAPDDDRKIAEIRRLVDRDGQDPTDLYSDPLRRVWRDEPSHRWSEAATWASRFMQWPEFDSHERDYKLVVAERVRAAREATESGKADWISALRRSFGGKNNLTSFYAHGKFLDWCDSQPEEARRLLLDLWADEPLDVRLPRCLAALPKAAVSGTGTRLSIVSFLLLGDEVGRYPFFKATANDGFRKLIGRPAHSELPLDDEDTTHRPETLALRLGVDGKKVRDYLRRQYPRDEGGADAEWHLTAEQAREVLDHFGDATDAVEEAAVYADFLMLLEELWFRTAALGTPMRDLLDAQGIVWWFVRGDAPETWSEPERAAFERFRSNVAQAEPDHGDVLETGTSKFPPVNQDLADELFVDVQFLEDTISLLDEKPQLIFYGPPGTGKTFIAKRLAKHLTSLGGASRIVQFHPSYTYEDFFEGYRPRSDASGHLGFELIGGALRELADAARKDLGAPYVLLIDEINRGNIAKIFGELYFLLEYRDEEIRLQYRPEETFSLPPNLYVLGTMNTADRSIALIDSALRRRFYFRALLPTEAPVADVLPRWLERNGHSSDAADLLAALNAAISDADFSIGPSYLMREHGKAPDLHRVWEFGILPLLEEHFFGTGRDVRAEFGLMALRKTLKGSVLAKVDDEPFGGVTDADAGG